MDQQQLEQLRGVCAEAGFARKGNASPTNELPSLCLTFLRVLALITKTIL